MTKERQVAAGWEPAGGSQSAGSCRDQSGKCDVTLVKVGACRYIDAVDDVLTRWVDLCGSWKKIQVKKQKKKCQKRLFDLTICQCCSNGAPS